MFILNLPSLGRASLSQLTVLAMQLVGGLVFTPILIATKYSLPHCVVRIGNFKGRGNGGIVILVAKNNQLFSD